MLARTSLLLAVTIALSVSFSLAVPGEHTTAGGGAKTGAPVRPDPAAAISATTSGNWGTIKGRVVFGGDSIPVPKLVHKKGAAPKDPEVCSARDTFSDELAVNKENKGIQSAVVYINRPPAIHPALAKAEGEVEFGQEHCMFKPRIFAYRFGQKVKVSSNDPVTHNTNVTPFAGTGFNLTIPAAAPGDKNVVEVGEIRAQQRPTPVVCNLHPWMKAWWFVFDHPYFAVSDENGAFEIKQAPAGTLKLVVWHEYFLYYGEGKREGNEIEVQPDGTTDLGNIVFQPK
jgi:hypothetical protein